MTEESNQPSNIQIDWGDGLEPEEGGAVYVSQTNSWIVQGAHAYAESDQYQVTITIDNATPIQKTVTILEAELTADGVAIESLDMELFDVTIGTFQDANPLSEEDEFEAEIDWGDESTSEGDSLLG